MSFRKATTIDELWSGEMTGLSIDGAPVLLLNIDGVVCAYEDWCPHQRSRLSTGGLQEGVLTCPNHHWQFDAATGRGINPKNVCLVPVPVRVDDGEIMVDITRAEAVSDSERNQGKS